MKRGTDMSDDYNIMGLEPEDARDYVIAVMTTLKATATKRVQLERELAMWEGRVKLASEKGRQELAAGAQARATEIQEQLTKIRVEEQGYRDGIGRMETQLKRLLTQPKMTVDADLLVAQMDMLLGEHSETDEKFREAEAGWALDDLKKKMDEEK